MIAEVYRGDLVAGNLSLSIVTGEALKGKMIDFGQYDILLDAGHSRKGEAG